MDLISSSSSEFWRPELGCQIDISCCNTRCRTRCGWMAGSWSWSWRFNPCLGSKILWYLTLPLNSQLYNNLPIKFQPQDRLLHQLGARLLQEAAPPPQPQLLLGLLPVLALLLVPNRPRLHGRVPLQLLQPLPLLPPFRSPIYPPGLLVVNFPPLTRRCLCSCLRWCTGTCLWRQNAWLAW